MFYFLHIYVKMNVCNNHFTFIAILVFLSSLAVSGLQDFMPASFWNSHSEGGKAGTAAAASAECCLAMPLEFHLVQVTFAGSLQSHQLCREGNKGQPTRTEDTLGLPHLCLRRSEMSALSAEGQADQTNSSLMSWLWPQITSTRETKMLLKCECCSGRNGTPHTRLSHNYESPLSQRRGHPRKTTTSMPQHSWEPSQVCTWMGKKINKHCEQLETSIQQASRKKGVVEESWSIYLNYINQKFGFVQVWFCALPSPGFHQGNSVVGLHWIHWHV